MKQREKWLAGILICLAYFGVVLIGSNWYLQKKRKLETERASLDSEWIVIETLLEDREKWNIRATWLDANQPPYGPSEQIDQALYEKAAATGIEGVETTRLTLLSPLETPHYQQAGVSLQVSGELPQVMPWIHSLVRPEEFQVVHNFRLKPDPENPASVAAQFELLRWHTPPKPSSQP